MLVYKKQISESFINPAPYSNQSHEEENLQNQLPNEYVQNDDSNLLEPMDGSSQSMDIEGEGEIQGYNI